jgi:hypothetical protein
LWERERKGTMRILGIESSCDETAASVVTDGRHLESNVVASQIDLHRQYGGVMPEVASRAHLRAIMPTIEDALRQANVDWSRIGAIAVTRGPGLAGSLLVGLYYHFYLGIIVSYIAVGMLGMAAGVIETLEPTIVSIAKGPARSGSSMGALTTSRSIGLFASNIILGVLYAYGPIFSYGFAFITAAAAGVVLLFAGRRFIDS